MCAPSLPIAVQITRRSGVSQFRIQNEVRGIEPASVLATSGTYLPINGGYLSVSGVYPGVFWTSLRELKNKSDNKLSALGGQQLFCLFSTLAAIQTSPPHSSQNKG